MCGHIRERKRGKRRRNNKRHKIYTMRFSPMMSFRYCCYNNNNNHYELGIKKRRNHPHPKSSLLVSNKRLRGWNEHDDCHTPTTLCMCVSVCQSSLRTSLVWIEPAVLSLDSAHARSVRCWFLIGKGAFGILNQKVDFIWLQSKYFMRRSLNIICCSSADSIFCSAKIQYFSFWFNEEY